jgi:Ni/Co efflux regulator RcnB
MKRFFTATAASTLALSLMTAPLASAQQMQQSHEDQKPQAAHEAPGGQRQLQPAQHAQLDERTTQHTNIQQRPIVQQHAQAPQRPPMQQHAQVQPSGHWQHGQHYTGERRVVSDWSRYHANPPPRGYEWVQDGNELVLISITSGVIASVLANAILQ